MRVPRARIVAAYDFSDPSEAALLEATRMARETNASLVVLHVFPARKAPGEWAWSGGAAQRDRERARLAELLEHRVADIRSLQVMASARLVDGDPTQVVLEVAAEEKAAAIFVGADAHEGFVGTLLGRVALRVVREARAPVFVVRRRASGSATDSVAGRRIVAGFDFTSAAMTALDTAAGLAKSTGGELRIVHVVPTAHALEGAALADLRTRLEELASEARARGVRATATVAFGDTATALVAETERDRRSVIALGMHARSSISRAVLGDVVEAVLRLTDSTVVVVHAERTAIPLVALPLVSNEEETR